ncbi:MAG: family 10 glycosylhydrolase, partial [Chthonomonadales bacterium]
HMDDYFYPYKEQNSKGQSIAFPDSTSYDAFRKKGGTLDRDDWRRSNVDKFIEDLYHAIHKARPTCKFGLSPFGIWRPHNPPSVTGLDQYSELYADARKWIREGWVDYWTPQLYWAVSSPGQSYPALLSWWCDQNVCKRNMWPGLYTSRVEAGWKAQEILDQIAVTRKQEGASGTVHFSMICILRNTKGIADALKKAYPDVALVPPTPWLDSNKLPAAAKLAYGENSDTRGYRAKWDDRSKGKVDKWVVQVFSGNKWSTTILPGTSHWLDVGGDVGKVDRFIVTPISITGVEGDVAEYYSR